MVGILSVGSQFLKSVVRKSHSSVTFICDLDFYTREFMLSSNMDCQIAHR